MVELVTICTFTSSRVPTMPSGSRDAMLIVNGEFLRQDVDDSRGPARDATARAVSMTRRTSSVLISRVRVGMDVTPRLLKLLMWRAGETHVNGFDLASRHRFGFTDALLDRLDRRFDIDDRPFL